MFKQWPGVVIGIYKVKIWLLYSMLPGGIIHFGTRYLDKGLPRYYIYIFALIVLSFGLFANMKLIKDRVDFINTMIISSIVLLYFVYIVSASSIAASRVFLIILSIYTSLYEEVLFRDKLLSFLIKQNSNKKIPSSIIVSILFGLMHFDFYHLPLYIIKSMLYCYLSIKAKSIFPSFVLHSINNIKYFSA